MIFVIVGGMLLSVIIVCVTNYLKEVNRNKPLPHAHRWTTVGSYRTNVFQKESDKYPVRTHTDFSRVCDDCGERDIKTVDGKWTENN